MAHLPLELFGFLAVMLRALTLALQSLVAGGVVFALVVERAAGSGSSAPLASTGRRLLVGASLALAVTAAIYVAVDSEVLMATTGLRLGQVAGAGYFLAGAAAALLALGVAALAGAGGAGGPGGHRARLAALALSAGLVVAAVATSHAAARLEGRPAALLLTALHQAAAACWIGGLPYLLIALAGSSDAAAAQAMTARFSRLAQVCVATLAAAGAGLSWLYVGSPAALLGTAYGAMVTTKAVLFALLLGLGALNLSIVRRVRAGDPGLLARLRRFGEAEVGIGFTAVLVAASLTSQPPAADLAAGDRVPLAEIAARMSPRWPRLLPPALGEMVSPGLLAAAAGPAGAAAAEPYVPGQLAAPLSPGELALSEFNHNVSGLVLLAAGLLAVGARAGWRWARNWPLSFILLAAFLFLLADADYWPLGPLGFWSGLTVPEVLQHRLVVLLIVAFAFYERSVQTGRARSPRAALVFPAVCALGGALLLTHSHSLDNPRDELLVELSHLSIAVLGIAAGWSRWLELRLGGGPRRALSWVWPICFVLVGVVLLIYRET
ncbi:MAG TPA: CopD family protein [Thermoanaerobaculia bacterium]|nr:CopD family protein [Thermoanaerobaculia bacterium]